MKVATDIDRTEYSNRKHVAAGRCAWLLLLYCFLSLIHFDFQHKVSVLCENCWCESKINRKHVKRSKLLAFHSFPVRFSRGNALLIFLEFIVFFFISLSHHWSLYEQTKMSKRYIGTIDKTNRWGIWLIVSDEILLESLYFCYVYAKNNVYQSPLPRFSQYYIAIPIDIIIYCFLTNAVKCRHIWNVSNFDWK